MRGGVIPSCVFPRFVSGHIFPREANVTFPDIYRRSIGRVIANIRNSLLVSRKRSLIVTDTFEPMLP